MFPPVQFVNTVPAGTPVFVASGNAPPEDTVVVVAGTVVVVAGTVVVVAGTVVVVAGRVVVVAGAVVVVTGLGSHVNTSAVADCAAVRSCGPAQVTLAVSPAAMGMADVAAPDEAAYPAIEPTSIPAATRAVAIFHRAARI